MVTFEQLVTRARNELGADVSPSASSRAIVERIVKSVIIGLGFHVSETTGEVCDPRPKPVVNYPYEQKGPQWPGSGRRR